MPDDIRTDAMPPGAKGSIAISNTGVLMPAGHEELWRTCALWHRSKMCPESFRDVSQVFFAHQTLASLGVNPLSYMRQVAFVKNSLTIFGDLPLALVQLNKRLQGYPEEFFIDADYKRICLQNKNLDAKVYAAVCRMLPRGDGQSVHERVWTIKDAEVAGKLPARFPSPWALYPKRMLALKARGWLIKDLFPDVLNGVAQGEYDFDVTQATDSSGKKYELLTPKQSADDLNKAYGDDDVDA